MQSILTQSTSGQRDSTIATTGVVMCSARKNPYPPPYGRSSEIPRGRGDLKAKIVEAKCEANLEFPGERCCGGRGGGCQNNKKTICGGNIDIFMEQHNLWQNWTIILLIKKCVWYFEMTSNLHDTSALNSADKMSDLNILCQL